MGRAGGTGGGGRRPAAPAWAAAAAPGRLLCPEGARRDRRSCRLTARIPDREANALVQRIGPQVHDPPGLTIDVDLDGITAGIAVQSGLIAFVSGGIV